MSSESNWAPSEIADAGCAECAARESCSLRRMVLAITKLRDGSKSVGVRSLLGATDSLKVALQRLNRTCRVAAANRRSTRRSCAPDHPDHAGGGTHWSTRKLAAKLGISDTTVLKVWQANGLKPHLVETFKVSRDPKFVEKLENIVGLYLSPPEHALVLCCDEKSQVQALDRTQPGLPLKKGRPTHRP